MLNAREVYAGALIRREGEELRVHIDLAKPRDAAGELEEGLNTFKYAHVREADFLSPC